MKFLFKFKQKVSEQKKKKKKYFNFEQMLSGLIYLIFLK